MKITATNLWDNGTPKQRSKLLAAIYRSKAFDYITDKPANEIPWGVLDRINQLISIKYKNNPPTLRRKQ